MTGQVSVELPMVIIVEIFVDGLEGGISNSGSPPSASTFSIPGLIGDVFEVIGRGFTFEPGEAAGTLELIGGRIDQVTYTGLGGRLFDWFFSFSGGRLENLRNAADPDAVLKAFLGLDHKLVVTGNATVNLPPGSDIRGLPFNFRGDDEFDFRDAPGGNTVAAGSGNDEILGSDFIDEIFGQNGNDRILAGDGNDRVFGGADDDRLILGAGDDEANGGAGNDVINGGAGRNLLRGGDGRNVYRFDDESAYNRLLDFVFGRDKVVVVDIPGIDTFQDVVDASRDRPGGVLIDLGSMRIFIEGGSVSLVAANSASFDF
jgi:Ca2+-binding RTX toxin-like protein